MMQNLALVMEKLWVQISLKEDLDVYQIYFTEYSLSLSLGRFIMSNLIWDGF